MAAGDLRPWMLYLAASADACRLAVNIPAQSALVPNVVPSNVLPSALALSSSTWSSSALAGPAAAGALLTVTGPGLIFAVNGAIAAAATTAPATRIGPNLAVGMLAATTAIAGIFLSLLATQRRTDQILLPFFSLFIGGSGCRDLCRDTARA